jgi:TetR/AcrR family transcriptional regulator, transcriptional repressor for nem operon
MASATPPPPTRRGQVTRERILDTATALMYDRGVAATSIDDVKAAAGVSSSQLYHYFADKRALVSAVIARQTERVLDFQETRLLDVEDRDALRAWRDGIVEVVQARGGAGGCPIGSLASELSGRDEAHRMALLAAFERWQEVIATGLARMRDRGSLIAAAEPGELALALLAALQGGLLLAQTRRSATPVAVALDAIIERITVSADGG